MEVAMEKAESWNGGFSLKVLCFVWEKSDRYMRLKQWKVPVLRQSQW